MVIITTLTQYQSKYLNNTNTIKVKYKIHVTVTTHYQNKYQIHFKAMQHNTIQCYQMPMQYPYEYNTHTTYQQRIQHQYNI